MNGTKTQIEQIIDKLNDPTICIVSLPPLHKDTNDMLQNGGTQAQFEQALRSAPSFLTILIHQAKDAPTTEKPDLLKEIARLIAKLDTLTADAYFDECKKAGFNKGTMKAAVKEVQGDDEGSESKVREIDIRDEWIVLNPNTRFGLSAWRRYGNGYWDEAHTEIVQREIMETCEENKIPTTTPRIKSISEMARLARFVPDQEWNRGQWLVMRNGSLDVETRTLHEHKPDDYMTRAIDYDYDPQADCPTFKYVLSSTILNSIDFIQEFAGYCLTRDTSREIAVWFYGEKGTGKSTVIEGFKAMLDGLHGLLGLSEIERTQFGLANLPGLQLVTCTEQPLSYVKSMHTVNAIISGELLKVEDKYKSAFSIEPTAKILWAMNSLPRVGQSTDGIFRRVKIVEFPRLTTTKDETLKYKIRKEGPGILNWALDGLQRLIENDRFTIDDDIQGATNDFELENDKPLLFIQERCSVGLGFDVAASDLYFAYKNWCTENGMQSESSVRMAREWKRLGFVKKRLSSGVYYEGLRLN